MNVALVLLAVAWMALVSRRKVVVCTHGILSTAFCSWCVRS